MEEAKSSDADDQISKMLRPEAKMETYMSEPN